MTYTNVPSQQPTSSGITPTWTAAAAAGNSYYDDDRTAVFFRNTNGSPTTVTVTTPGTVDGMPIPDKTIVVPATTGEKWAAFSLKDYIQPPGSQYEGQILLDFSAVTNLTLAVIRIGG